MARILNYHSYIEYCQKLNRTIVTYSLKNYESANMFEEIDKIGPLSSNKAAHQKLFKAIEAIRKKNA